MTDFDKIRKQVCEFWKGEEFDDKLRFPGAQPISLELKDIATIKRNEYWICPKLDGERFFLISRYEQIFLINRNMEFTPVKLTVNPYILKKGIILDGELLPGHFVIHDAIEVLGKNVKMLDFDKRWASANSIMKMFGEGDFKVTLKSFWKPNQLPQMIKWMESNKIPTDGIVLYPLKGPIGYKTQMNFFKWKPPGHHTIDFIVRKCSNTMASLITWSKSRETEFSKIQLLDFQNVTNFNPDGCVVEFNTLLDNGNTIFVPIKVRSDKPIGNNLYTVRKTILNVKENITIDKLISLLS